MKLKKLISAVVLITLSVTMAICATACFGGGATKYTVTLDANGGQLANDVTTVEVTLGENYTLPTPTKTGYDFVSWQNQDENVASTGTWEIESDVSLKAKWTAKTTTVTLNVNGGTGATETTLTATYGQVLSLPTVTKTGYNFAGWKLGNDDYNVTSAWTIEDSSVTLTATWTAKTTTVTLNLDGGTIDGQTTITATYGQTITLPTVTKTGYDFAGWTLNGNEYDVTSNWAVESATATLVANWTESAPVVKTTTVTLDLDDGTIVGPTTIIATYGQTLTLNEPTKVGYDFDCWLLNGNEYDEESAWALEDATATLTATWTAKTTTVTLNLDGGTIEGNTTVIATYGQVLTLKEPTKGGYKFDCWLLKGNEYDEESEWALEDATATLTATWTAKTTTVTLNLAGGTIEGETTITAKYGEVLTLNKPTKVGFVFVCWTLNGQNYDATSAWTLDAETATLVATWNDNPTVITIDVNGGNALPTESEIVYGNKGQVLTLPTVTKTGYNPAGWTLNGEAYDVDGEWTLEGGTAILVAQWTAKTTTVTLNLDGGTIEGNTTVIATYGQVLTLKEPTKGGYKFVRWLYNGQAIDLTQIWETDAESIELVAEYVGVTVKVTIKYDGFDVEASEQKVIFDGAYELKSTVAGYNISKLVIEDSETEVAVSGDNWAYSENVTLVATLAPKTYNVNIIGYYGEAIAQIVVTYGETVDFAKYLPTEGGFEVDEVIVSVEKFVYVNGVQKFFDGYKVEDAEYKFDLSKTSEAIWGYAFEGDDVTIRATYESEEIWI